MKRFARQIQLAEVGSSGQQRIARFPLRIVPSASAEETIFAQLYALRCGLGEDNFAQPDNCPPPAPYPLEIASHFRHSSAQKLGVGAAIVQQQVLLALVDEQ